MSAHGITIVNASAGSGKTTRLTKHVADAVSPSAAHPIQLEGLFAVTYTRKAHGELTARIRRKLVEEGAFDLARELPLAYLGTVHSTCLRLLQEFALDAGLSPHVDVVAEDQGKLLRQSLDHALPPELRNRVDALAARVELHWDAKVERSDWVRPVDKIMSLARANRIPSEALPEMAARSAKGLLQLLKPVHSDADTMDRALKGEIDIALQRLGTVDDTGVTVSAVATLRDVKRRMDDHELRWSDWAKLAKLKASKASDPKLDRLREAANQYEAHPRLHEDLRELVLGIYEAAAVGLAGYQAWKGRQRVVDYVDMLDRALTLLDAPRVRDELVQRLSLSVVDEFQDTSPIQLALFVEIHKLSGRSVWVGDRKQCIFEYAGADPQLMDAVAEWVARSGGSSERLEDNHRSRPELVDACSQLFSHALLRHGFSREEVVVAPKRDASALGDLPPFGLFRLDAKNGHDAALAIANGVARLLANPNATHVIDRTTGERRPVRAGDIAVLVATNLEAESVAGALHERTIRASVARTGLLSTPEGTLADSALRWLLDSRDSLAAANLDALTGFNGQSPEVWLAGILEARDVSTSNPGPTLTPVEGWRAALEAVRPTLSKLSPTEVFDAALDALDAVTLCARWPRAPERMANLDALRALAATYEERCGEEREACTVAGLLRYFDAARRVVLQRTEMIASDDQHVTSDDESVTVCTYHKSKGLEWPVVILASLEREDRRDVFDVSPETDHAKFDPTCPLAGRWIRYWPWPFGQTSAVPLSDYGASSPEGVQIALREEKERARLLYVGFTRARDHLVLAVRVKSSRGGDKAQTSWLDTLADAKGVPVLALPLDAADNQLATLQIRRESGATLGVPARVWRLDAALSASDATPHLAHPKWFVRPTESVPRVPYRIVPSSAELDWPEIEAMAEGVRLGAVETLGTAVRLDGNAYDYEALGTATHAFFAADVEGISADVRVACADRLLSSVGMSGVVRGSALVSASDGLRAWVHSRWPEARWHREIPLDALVPSAGGERRVSGIVDLLLETNDGLVIVDHKTFPGIGEGAWRKKALEVAKQLVVYAHVLQSVPGMKVLGAWVHLPMGGGMVEVVVPLRGSDAC